MESFIMEEIVTQQTDLPKILVKGKSMIFLKIYQKSLRASDGFSHYSQRSWISFVCSVLKKQCVTAALKL